MGCAMLLLGVKSFSSVPWLIDLVIGCGFVTAWMVTLSGWWLVVAKRGGLCVFTWRREKHIKREKKMSHE